MGIIIFLFSNLVNKSSIIKNLIIDHFNNFFYKKTWKGKGYIMFQNLDIYKVKHYNYELEKDDFIK